MKSDRIAITLSDILLKEVEIFRKKTGDSRSGFIQKAIKKYLNDQRKAKKIAQYIKGYEENPETEKEIEEIHSISAQLFKEDV
ncbi:hypothetical protein ACFL35_16510 [Candidatus Riflebacteria bacterium]